MHNLELVLHDCVGWADARADGVFAMHADLNRRLGRDASVDVIDMDHAYIAVRLTLGAGHLACVTPDAPLRVEVEARQTVVNVFTVRWTLLSLLAAAPEGRCGQYLEDCRYSP